MDKQAQQFTPEEAKKWIVQGPQRFSPQGSFDAARRFFQVWNKKKGRGASKDVIADEPLRCTIWRDRAMNYEKLLQDLLTDAIPAYASALQQVYPELQKAAETNPELERRLKIVERITGTREPLVPEMKGEWEHETQKLELEPAGKTIQPATKIVSKYFYKTLEAVPALQQKFVELAAKEIYTNYEAGAGGYWAGQTTKKEPRKLLTFFLMSDPYPYLRSEPLRPDGSTYTKETKEELCNDWGGKTSEENPAPGKSMGKKVSTPFASYKCPNGSVIVRNAENPDYDFAVLTGPEARDPKLQKEKVSELLSKTRTAALFDPTFFLGKNVFQSPLTGISDKGVSLYGLANAKIDESDRDLTKLPDAGLFWVPKRGLPKSLSAAPEEKINVTPGGKFQLPPKQQTLTSGLIEVFGQSTEDGGIWVDDEGKMYDTMQELLSVYDEKNKLAIETVLPNAIEAMIRDDLEGAVLPDAPMYDVEEEPEAEEVEEVEEPEAEILYPWQETEDEEEEELAALPLAAQKIERLIRLANTLDSKGHCEEANVVDEVIKGLVEQMTRQNR